MLESIEGGGQVHILMSMHIYFALSVLIILFFNILEVVRSVEYEVS